jgi:hypothetical protein
MKLKAYLLTVMTLMTTTLFSEVLLAASDNVAKVVLMRGSVKAKFADGNLVDVKADQSIPEGATVQTAEKSFVKLVFIDKSQMNLGPNSQMIITAFPKKSAGIITLVKGQIRSQVTKDYMEMDDKAKSKLYIKTKTAAMGIRGTDFQVNFNPENQNTALITFEGKVAMAHIEKGVRDQVFDQGKLERVVSSDKAVMVVQGQISAVNLNVAERAMEPTKLGTKQIEALEKNETGLKESSSGASDKQYRNPIPPGADGAAFSNTAPDIEKEIKKMGAADIKTAVSNPGKTVNADGFFNASTGEYKMPAGSIVDLNTVNIIPPPANAVFDSNSGTYVVPESYGKIDKVTGEYKAPAGLQLGVDGKFVVVDAEAYQKAQAPAEQDEKKEDKKEEKKEDKKEEKKSDEAKVDSKDEKKSDVASDKTKADGSRAPASAAPAAATIKLDVPKIYDARPEMANFAAKHSTSPVNVIAPANNGQLKDLANQTMQRNEVSRQTASEATNAVQTSTRTQFIFNTIP